jgi:hypothetical protein
MQTRFHCLAAALFLAATTTACGSVTVSETVTGTVVDADGVPLPGALVLIGGSTISTDGAGRFSAAGVVAPYDVAIVGAAPALPAEPHVYLGMSDTAPTFRLDYEAEPRQSCTLVVTFPSTGSPTLDASVVLEVPDGSPHVAYGTALGPSPHTELLDLWWSAPAAKVRAHAFTIQVDPVTGSPVHYVGYDTIELDLAEGAALQWSPAWKPSPFSESVVSTTVDVPPGYAFDTSTLSTFGAGLAGGKAAPEVSFVVPEIPGASFVIGAQASGDSGTSRATSPAVAPGTQGLHLTIDRTPVLSAPADGGPLGVGSPVTWTSPGEGTPVVLATPNDSTSPSYYLLGGEGATTFPDLSALGVSLPHHASYTVYVFRNGAAATVDDLAAQGPFFTPITQPSTYGVSATHQVTTP